jgi:hypothetical protein
LAATSDAHQTEKSRQGQGRSGDEIQRASWFDERGYEDEAGDEG